MADKCTGFVKKQQEPKINDGEHKSSVTDDSTASTEVKTAINVDDKNAHNAKSMLSSVGAAEIESANVPLASRTTAHIPSNDSKTTKFTTTATTTATATTTITTNTPNDIISSKTMNALDEITTSPSSSQASVVADIVMTESELMEMKESTTAAGIQSTATTPIHKGIESDYLNENENEADEISENGDNFLYETRANAEKVMYLNLETPVLDDNNEFMEVDQRQCHGGVQQSQPHYCKRGFRKISENGANFTVTKPKRLSDEFNSANDDIRNNQQLLPVVNTIGEKVSQSDLMIGEGSPDDNSNNASESEIVKLNRSSDIIDDDTSTSSLINIANKQPPIQEHMEDSSSPHSSMSPADVAISDQKQQMEHLSDVVEELTNHGDEHQQRSDHFFANSQRLFASSNQLYTNNDVQSMDAIERRDFINEQEATANCILGNSSLIINGTNGDEPRLNLDLLGNSFSQKMEQIAALTEEQTTKRNNADNVTSTENGAQNAISGNDQLITTPTTSRTKRSRLPFPGEKSTLARSLEKSSDSDKESSSLAWDASHRESPDTNSTTMPDALNHSGECNCETDDVDGQQESTSKSSCSNCNKEPINEPRLDEDAKTDLDDDEDLDDDAGDHDDIEENGEPSSTSPANASRARCNGNSSCTSTCKNKHSNSDNSNQNAAAAAAADLPANVSPSYYREAGIMLEDEDIKDYENETIDKNFRLMMGLEPENPYADWSCEVNSDGEEVCTCRDFTDNETTANSEDELPSRDVDLSCYSISADVLNSNGNSSTDTPTSRNHRKRKLTENRTSIFSDTTSGCSDANSNDRKRLALDETGVSHKLNSSSSGSQPSTPTSSSTNISLRTPRSVIPTRDNPPPELSDWLNQFKQWSHVERLVAVDRLIEHCEPTQVRHMMKVIEPQFQRDFISLLPEELALQVLSYLAPKDLLRAAQTCKSWRALCDDNLLWKEKCKQLNISIESSKDRPKRGRIGNMPPISSPWKAAYMRQHIIEMNWRSRPIREPKILKGHDDHVITCLQFCGNRIVSGSDDNTLKVWSAVTGKCLRTLVGHTGGVWSSQMSANIIISGSTDRTLKVWNADNGYCIHTLTGHTSTVRCMHLHEKKVVSGSRDATLRVWDIVQGKCLHTLVGHLAAVRCVQYDGKLVVSGAYDYMVKVWNPETEECLHTLQGHTNRVYSLQFDGVHVVSGSLDTSIRVWDAITGTCKHTLMGHQSLTSGMELRQNILVSGNADSTVKVWDTTNGQCLQTLSGPNKHQSAVTCLQFNSRFVITSSDDGTVKLWDVRTGEFIRNLVTLESGGSGGVVWRIRSNDTKLICAVGSRNGTEETKLMVLDFDVEGACLKCS